MISLIVALAKNNVIGSKNKVPWLLKADLVRLKHLTLDQVVILGRKTYDSMVWYYGKSGREMPGRIYIVVTANQNYKPKRPKTIVVHSIQQALQKANELTDEAFVIGGAQLYAAMLPFADRLYITELDATIEGDTFFPVLQPKTWREISREIHSKDDKNQFDYAFVTLVRQKD